MRHFRLRKYMTKEHFFLYKLYREKEGHINRVTLQRATVKQIWLVLRLLFCIAVGHIPLTYKNYQSLVRSKRKNNLRSLKNKMRYFRTKGESEARRKFVLQFSSLFPFLFHDLFVKAKNQTI